MQIFKKLGWFFKEEKKAYTLGVISLILVALLQVITPRMIGMIVDAINIGTLTSSRLWKMVGIIVVARNRSVCVTLCMAYEYLGSRDSFRKTIKKNLFHHFTRMDQIFFQTYRTGDLMAHATNDLNAIQMVAGAWYFNVGGLVT